MKIKNRGAHVGEPTTVGFVIVAEGFSPAGLSRPWRQKRSGENVVTEVRPPEFPAKPEGYYKAEFKPLVNR